MHIHILGICGTFMGGLALIARELGMKVTGSDANVYPPMSTQLQEAGIELTEGYDPAVLDPAPDQVVIGNAMSRGNACVEYVLDRGLEYVSGPQWLSEHVLRERWVLAVAGTHGKTTTSSMLAWILADAGLDPGFLIGGVPGNFAQSARLGSSSFFVVEADEYDTAFFDKRSKFVHYRPRTLILNNLEFDHADIFPDLEAIMRQFHHLMRIVPGNGLVIRPQDDRNLDRVIEMGCWTPLETFAAQATGAADWTARPLVADAGRFDVVCQGDTAGRVAWEMAGSHNVGNGLAAIAAARHAGVMPAAAIEALSGFQGVKRRLELRGEPAGIAVYDDFAHHPTAIEATLSALRARVGARRIVAILEPRSNTMRQGIHRDTLAASLRGADEVLLFDCGDLPWDLGEVERALGDQCHRFDDIQSMVDRVGNHAASGDVILVMSNGGFGGIHERLIERLAAR